MTMHDVFEKNNKNIEKKVQTQSLPKGSLQVLCHYKLF